MKSTSRLLLPALFLFAAMGARGQDTGSRLQLTLAEPGGQSRQYEVRHCTYTVGLQPEDHTAGLSVNVTLKGLADTLILRHLADTARRLDGRITSTDIRSGKVNGEVSFKGARLDRLQESFTIYDNDGGSDNMEANFSISSVKAGVIGNVPIKLKHQP